MIAHTVSLSLWLLAFLCSFTFLPLYQSEMAVTTILSLLFAGLIRFYSGLKQGQWSYYKEPVLVLLGLFWLVALGSVFWSHIPWISLPQFWVFSCLPLSVLFFMNGSYEIALKIVAFMLGLFAIFAVYQYYMLPEMLYEGRVKWPLKNPNSLGAVFSIGGFLVLGQFFKTKSQWWLVCFMLMVIGLVTTGSRGAFGAFTLGLIFFFFVVRPTICWKKAGGMFVTLVVIICALTFSGIRPDNMALVSSVHTVTGEHSLLWSRSDLWTSTWEMIKAHPWLGTGIGTFPQFYEQVRAPKEYSAGFMAHNDPLQFWAEMGISAFVLFYAFVAMMCVRTWKTLKGVDNKDRRIAILIPFVALGAMVLHTHVSFNLHIIPILFLSGLCIAMWCRAVSDKSIKIKRPVWLSLRNAEPLFVLFLLVCIALIIPPFMSNYHVMKANRSDQYHNIEAFVEHVNQAQRWSVGLSSQPYLMAFPIQISILEQDIDVLMPSLKEKAIQDLHDHLDRAESLNPRAVGVPYNRALLAQLLTEDDPAYGDIDRYLERAIFLKPRYFPARFWLVDRHKARGNVEQALEVLNPSLVWCQRSRYAEECYSRMAAMLLEVGDVLGSQKMLKGVQSIRERGKPK